MRTAAMASRPAFFWADSRSFGLVTVTVILLWKLSHWRQAHPQVSTFLRSGVALTEAWVRQSNSVMVLVFYLIAGMDWRMQRSGFSDDQSVWFDVCIPGRKPWWAGFPEWSSEMTAGCMEETDREGLKRQDHLPATWVRTFRSSSRKNRVRNEPHEEKTQSRQAGSFTVTEFPPDKDGPWLATGRKRGKERPCRAATVC